MIALLFDVDDTLYLRRDPYIEAAGEMREGLSRIDGDALFQRSRVIGEEEFQRSLRGELTKEEMEISRAVRTFASFGVELTREEAARFQALYEKHQRKIRLHPAVEEALSALSGRPGVFLGVLTNGSRGHQRGKCACLGLGRFIREEDILTSEEAGAAKPDVRFFARYAKEHGLSPEKAWMIGDSYEADIRGAKAASWNTVWVPRYGEEQRIACPDAADRIALGDEALAALLLALADGENKPLVSCPPGEVPL